MLTICLIPLPATEPELDKGATAAVQTGVVCDV